METTDTKVMATTSEPREANFEIIDYSEKAIAVVGDTREIKDALKRLGGRFNARLKCGPGCIFSKSKREQVEALKRGEIPAQSEPKAKSGRKSEPMPDYFLTADERREFWENEDRGDVEYYMKRYPLAVRLTDGRVIFCERVGLETSFCFGHGQNGITTEEDTRRARDNERFASSEESYFIDENMAGIREKVAKAKGEFKRHSYKDNCKYCFSYSPRGEGHNYLEVYFSDYTKEELMACNRDWCWLAESHKKTLTLIEGEDRKRVVKLYEAEEANRLRRVQTYLKRYGLSKLKTWTYLVD